MTIALALFGMTILAAGLGTLLLPTAEAEDGWMSYSEHRRGTASWHGGVRRWLNRPPD